MIIGKGNRIIPASKFYFNEDLVDITISDDVARIEDWAFGYCTKLVRIFIPKSVEYISPNTFDGCEALAQIQVDPDNPFYSSVDGVLYNKDFTRLIRFPSNHKSQRYIVAESVTELEILSFNRCPNLREVILPPNLTVIGEKSFAYCTKLKTITIPDGVQEIGDYALSDCYSLEKVQLNNHRFCTVDDVLYRIEDHHKILLQYPLAKESREFLIPDDVSQIKDRALIGAKYLTDIHALHNAFFRSEEGVLYETQPNRLICLPSQKHIDIFVVPDKVEIIGNSSMKMNEHLERVIFPQNLSLIQRHALEDCVSVEEVDFRGSRLEKIEWSAFWGCKNLKAIDLSRQAALFIDSLAFAKCENLERVCLPQACTMGRGVFRECFKLSTNQRT